MNEAFSFCRIWIELWKFILVEGWIDGWMDELLEQVGGLLNAKIFHNSVSISCECVGRFRFNEFVLNCLISLIV